jgi:thiol:disulfide interchange protein DsbC
MQASRWVAALLTAVCAAAPVLAADDVPPISKEVIAKVRAALKERVPQLTVLDVRGSEIPGLYEVLAPDGVTYTDITGNYVLMGSLIDTRAHRNLSQVHWQDFNRVDYASLPFRLAIKSVKGDGSRQIAVFADPKCPFCQQLEQQLDKMDNITIYTFLYPLEEIHPGATAQAHQIWCSADREATWTHWMRKHETPAPGADCKDDPVKELAAFGEHLHIITTPTIIFPSGERSPGLPSQQQFDQMLATQTVVPAAAKPDAHPDSSPNS